MSIKKKKKDPELLYQSNYLQGCVQFNFFFFLFHIVFLIVPIAPPRIPMLISALSSEFWNPRWCDGDPLMYWYLKEILKKLIYQSEKLDMLYHIYFTIFFLF